MEAINYYTTHKEWNDSMTISLLLKREMKPTAIYGTS